MIEKQSLLLLSHVELLMTNSELAQLEELHKPKTKRKERRSNKYGETSFAMDGLRPVPLALLNSRCCGDLGGARQSRAKQQFSI